MTKKNRLISSGFGFFRRTRLHQLAAAVTRGAGAILMFHQVRPWVTRDFAPNRLLEITPEFLDAVLTRLKALGFAIVDPDEALTMIAARNEQPFAVLTFDDGYKDTRDFALPILEKHAAPFTMYVASGFAERTARLWWVELEEAIARLPRLWCFGGGARSRSAGGEPGGEERRFRDPLSNSERRFGGRICSRSSLISRARRASTRMQFRASFALIGRGSRRWPSIRFAQSAFIR